MSEEGIKFVPLNVFVDPAFWAEVNRRRLDEWQLECPELSVQATFDLYGKNPVLTLNHDALSEEVVHSSHSAVIPGKLKLFGTLKEFKELNAKEKLAQLKESLWSKIKSGLDTSNLSQFYFTGFADLKQYNYYYVNCLPALIYPSEIKSTVIDGLASELHTTVFDYYKQTGELFFYLDDQDVARKLSDLPQLADNVTVVFINSASVPGHPGWLARNLLAALAYHRPTWNTVNLLALRGNLESSFTSKVSWKPSMSDAVPEAVGWSKPTSVSLKAVFDPVNVNMNLKLVRWRLVPDLKLENLFDLKILMIGSGTLGCNLARSLLGWGIKNITFIDNSVVSYNNPIRQSLFEFEDAKAGNKSKSLAAAEALKRIYPSVNTVGLNIKIPMPGHPVSEQEKEKVKQTCAQLAELIQSHDVVYLVMDSRESRWLPTLLATHYGKVAFTVALGFDSFVVMRHGVRGSDEIAQPEVPGEVSGSELGCYYCSDVTAPGNSLDDRTLDQNCTITRAGISSIASGIAVEMLASLTQHPQGVAAPSKEVGIDESSSILGATPHQIRGFLSRYHFMTPTIRRFSQCTACGQTVQDVFAQRGFEFLNEVFSNSSELEKISGLDTLQYSMDKVSLEDLEETDSD